MLQYSVKAAAVGVTELQCLEQAAESRSWQVAAARMNLDINVGGGSIMAEFS